MEDRLRGLRDRDDGVCFLLMWLLGSQWTDEHRYGVQFPELPWWRGGTGGWSLAWPDGLPV